CAIPMSMPDGSLNSERMDAGFPLPTLPASATLLAADGSQISFDRHAEVAYSLVNVGAIQMRLGSPAPPQTTIKCELFYDERLYEQTEAILALTRDLQERAMLAELAAQVEPPVISFTDGPVELWGVKDGSPQEQSAYQQSLEKYLDVLTRLCELDVITAGYVDKPGANLVVRLLEVASAQPADLANIRRYQPLRGVTDKALFQEMLAPGERSAVFAIQSQSAKRYPGQLSLHFFYLNVGRQGYPSLARVEVPAWVAQDPQKLEALHAVLVDQCRVLGVRPYPYLLHRAHETARVGLQERDQVTQMILLELRRRGLAVDGVSNKQFAKDQPGRSRL
ncbi:MAG: DNA double-strand break repair nuclease NurA, partial [Anaerolineales bacterium]